MSVAIAERPRGRKGPRTPALDLGEALVELSLSARSVEWPSLRYRDDPVGFCRDILGFEPWAKQIEILEAVRDDPLVSVKSGHRIGKSSVAAALALWFFCCFEEARIVCTAPGTRQVEGILWREIKRLYGRSGRCVDCRQPRADGTRVARPCPHSAVIDGVLGMKPATGLVTDDTQPGETREGLVTGYREVRGYTAKDVEAITGTAGANLLFILDEASGIADAIYEGLEGNRAGWAETPGIMVRMLLIGNPTKTSGEFYDSHEHPKKKLVYTRITVSSRETPNVTSGRGTIPGLATAEWIEQMEAKYGEGSAFVRVRVDGEFPTGEDGKAFSIALITEAEERWDADDPGDGPLYIGIDPAGESGTGDEAAMSARRGLMQRRLLTWRGLSPEAHGVHLLGLITELRTHPRERAIVVMDSEGAVGANVYSHLSAMAAKPGAMFELHRVRASDKAWREPTTFGTVRDELAHSLSLWLRGGGAILEDEKLAQELHELEWEQVNGRLKITPKKVIRKNLGRSPDRFDALALSVWEPLAASAGTGHGGGRVDDSPDDEDDVAERIDPYRARGRIDPYGGRRR